MIISAGILTVFDEAPLAMRLAANPNCVRSLDSCLRAYQSGGKPSEVLTSSLAPLESRRWKMSSLPWWTATWRGVLQMKGKFWRVRIDLLQTTHLLLLTVTYSNVLLCTLYSLAWRHMWVGDFLRCVTNLSKTQTRLQSSYHDSSFCALGSAFMSISFSATFLMLSNFAAMWSGVSPDSGVETLTWAPWSQRNNAENSSCEKN